ncbi:MAG: flagellar filament capping protein FliD [Nitrospinae bacterium]|nr:flagellar filament capping protein FliD [Nitrospinota bacterium]
MEVNGFPSSYFPPFSFLRPAPTESQARDARTQLTTPGSPPPSPSDTLFSSFIFVSQKTPPAELTGPLAAMRVLDSFNTLKTLSDQTRIPIVSDLDRKPRFSELQQDTLNGIKDSAQTLSSTVDRLLRKESLNTRAVRTTPTGILSAQAGNATPLTAVSVVARQVSTGNALSSDVQSFPFPALGKTGSFVVNGVSVSVVASDTIVTLKNKINRGEDANGNGILDGREDLNGNGVADVITVAPSPFGAGVFVAEDANGDGQLDPNEDANDNDRLDGGTAEHKVVATIEDDRLKLTSRAGGSTKIDLQDPNNILLSLGFFELNGKGLPIQKEAQFNSDEPPRNLIVNPRKAEIEVGGKVVASDSNDFSGVIDEGVLTVKKTSGKKVAVDISLDADSAMSQIKTLFENYNDTITMVNRSLQFSKAFQTDPDIQRVRQDLVSSAQGEIPEITKQNREIDKIRGKTQNLNIIGFKFQNAEKDVLNETMVTSNVQSIKDGLTLPFKNAPNDLLRRLSSVGIQTVEDDTVAVNEVELRKALDINTAGVLDILNNADTGILPKLQNQLSAVLAKDFGAIDVKRTKIQNTSQIPSALREIYQKFIQNTTEKDKTQTLIAVA